MTDEELKARVLAEAEKAIEEVMANRAIGPQVSLREIEGLAVRAGGGVSVGVQTVWSEEVSQRQRN